MAFPTCFLIDLADRAAGADDALQVENMHGSPALATCASLIGKPDIASTSSAVTNVVEWCCCLMRSVRTKYPDPAMTVMNVASSRLMSRARLVGFLGNIDHVGTRVLLP